MFIMNLKRGMRIVIIIKLAPISPSPYKATNTHIDHLVYKLYNLTDEEISVVEGV